MAQKVQTILVDDIEDKEIAEGKGETMTFALDGVSYEIDLNDKNAANLRDAVKFYADHGRRVGGRRSSGTATAKPAREYDIAAVRSWAASTKIDVPARGRIPKAIIDQYKAAGN